MDHSSFSTMPGVAELFLTAPRLLLGLDYDGTLTPIVDDPAQAFLPTRTKQIIEALARRIDVAVAIISGRAHADVHDLVGIPDLIYASNHGIEIRGPGMNYLKPGAQASSQTLQVLALNLAKQLRPIQGAFVENKGYTLSVHYRRVARDNRESVRQIVLHAVELISHRYQVTTGDNIFDIRPLLHWNKGTALCWILGQLGMDYLAVYLGDDTTDEDAFLALSDQAITIKVGDREPTAARYRLAGPSTVCDFLEEVHELRQQRTTAIATT
jgi:trehalose-phosphatase